MEFIALLTIGTSLCALVGYLVTVDDCPWAMHRSVHLKILTARLHEVLDCGTGKDSAGIWRSSSVMSDRSLTHHLQIMRRTPGAPKTPPQKFSASNIVKFSCTVEYLVDE